MSETGENIPRLTRLIQRITHRGGKQERAEKKDNIRNLTPDEVLQLVRDNGTEQIPVYSPDSPKSLVSVNQVNGETLENLPNYSVISFRKPPDNCQTALVVKKDVTYKTDFTSDWTVERGSFQDIKTQREQRWQRLVELKWPVALWHGTNAENQQKILTGKRHYLLVQETFVDVFGYAAQCGERVLAYALPACDLSVAQSIGVNKIGVNPKLELKYIGEGEFNNQGKRRFLDINQVLEYPYSTDLEKYLRSSNMSFEKTTGSDGGSQIRVPILQQNYTGEVLEEGPRPWKSDLKEPEVITFKDGARIKIPAKEISVPE